MVSILLELTAVWHWDWVAFQVHFVIIIVIISQSSLTFLFVLMNLLFLFTLKQYSVFLHLDLKIWLFWLFLSVIAQITINRVIVGITIVWHWQLIFTFSCITQLTPNSYVINSNTLCFKKIIKILKEKHHCSVLAIDQNAIRKNWPKMYYKMKQNNRIKQ